MIFRLSTPKNMYGCKWTDPDPHGLDGLSCSVSEHCHNHFFTHGIFSGVGMQNEAARTKPAWSDEGSPWQITSKRGPGHISWSPTKFDPGWPSLTKGWPGFDQAVPDSTRVHHAKKPRKTWSGIHFPEFGELWPNLTKFD